MPSKKFFWPLFFVSTSTIALEVSLLRYFAVTSWQAFGAMVISIALIGFAVSGTVLTLAHKFFRNKSGTKLLVVAFLYLVTIPLSFLLANGVPFNPNKMLNAHEIVAEVLHLTEYMLLFFVPFFFAGLYTGLVFIHHHDDIGKIYFFDLVGAGTGSLLVLGAMFFISPFSLAEFVFVLAFLAFGLTAVQSGLKVGVWGSLAGAALVVLVLFVWENHADYKAYKPIRQAELVAGNTPLLKHPVLSPIGIMEVMSNATEKATLPLSDEFSLLVPDGKVPDIYPGFYLDGNRLDGLVAAEPDSRFIQYNLYAAPFILKDHPDVLIIGSGGGFSTYQALTLGARRVKVIESNPFLLDLLKNRFASLNGGLFEKPEVHVEVNDGRSFALREKHRYDLLQISDAAIAARPDENYLLTTQAFADDSHLLKPNGLLTVSIDITDNFFYALRLLRTLTAYFQDRHEAPSSHLVILRSLFKMLFLIKNSNFSTEEVGQLRQWASNLGFDTVYFPGATGQETIFSLAPFIPVLAQEKGTDATVGQDSLLKDDEFYRLTSELISGTTHLNRGIFDYRPSTDDRPYFFSLLSPDRLVSALKTYELGGLPQQEVNSLVLYAEFANVVVFAFFIVLIPVVARLFQRRTTHLGLGFFSKSLLYFASLGLGFLFIEIVLIQKLALFLGDIIYSFTLVLSSILVFAGLGSFLSERIRRAALAVRVAAVVIVLGILFTVFVLPVWIRDLGTLAFPFRLILSFFFVMPLAIPLGVFFPLGLGQMTGNRRSFVPWAWSINGAFSVVSTVSARILSQTYGFSFVLALAAGLYLLAALTFPSQKASEVGAVEA